MKTRMVLTLLTIACATLATIANAGRAEGDFAFREGKPEIASMSALAFGPDGELFIGDGKGGAVFAIDLGKKKAPPKNVKLEIPDVEGVIAAALGTSSAEIMIHDMAVHPVSQNVYLAVSRGRGKWSLHWQLPNDLADAHILLEVDADGEIAEVPLENVRFARAALPNPVDPAKMHPWKKEIRLRADTITQMAYDDGTLYVAGLSNEEFSSTMWRLPYPFVADISTTTLEIFHGAHGQYETHAPIRAFVPYDLNDRPHLLAAYLCTPLVTFETEGLEDGAHVKGRTVAEFGSGNYPLDMVVYRKNGQDRLLIANSNLPFMIVDPKEIESFKGSITEEVKDYLAGVRYAPRSGTGVQQLARLNDEHLLALKRLPGGTMDMVSLPVARF